MFTDTSTQVVGHVFARNLMVSRRTMLKSAALAGALAATGMHSRAAPAYQATPAATPGPPPFELKQYYEVVIQPELMPDMLETIAAGIWVVDPQTDVFVEESNEAIRARAIYLESGALTVWPAVASPLWRAVMANGGEAETVPPGEPVDLQVGDVLYLPAIPPAGLPASRLVRLANTSDDIARTFSVHLHDERGRFHGWPTGVRDAPPDSQLAELLNAAEIQSNPLTLRLSRITAPADAVIPLVEHAAFIGYFVVEGTLVYRGTGDSGTTWRNRWPTGQSGWIITLPNVTHEVSVTGRGPASFYELAVFTGATLEEVATPAP